MFSVLFNDEEAVGSRCGCTLRRLNREATRKNVLLTNT